MRPLKKKVNKKREAEDDKVWRKGYEVGIEKGIELGRKQLQEEFQTLMNIQNTYNN